MSMSTYDFLRGLREFTVYNVSSILVHNDVKFIVIFHATIYAKERAEYHCHSLKENNEPKQCR